MLKVNFTSKFQKDLKKAEKRNLDIELLKNIIRQLASEIPLDPKHKEHPLTGDFNGFRECHIAPDWLLIYYIENDIITFSRTGTHADLF